MEYISNIVYSMVKQQSAANPITSFSATTSEFIF